MQIILLLLLEQLNLGCQTQLCNMDTSVQNYCFLGLLMSRTVLTVKPLIVAQISILSVENGIKSKLFVELSVHAIMLTVLLQCPATLLSLVKWTNSAIPCP